MSHDIVSLYEKLEQDYGLNAVHLDPRSTSASLELIAQDGLPLQIGWFDDASKCNTDLSRRLFGHNTYALTSIAPPHERFITG